MASEVSRGVVKVVAAGGVDEDIIGLDASRIEKAIREAYTSSGVLILFDLGSALLSTQLALDALSEEQQANIQISSAPLVEGTIAAVVEASLGHDLEQVRMAAEAIVETKTNLVDSHI